MTTSLGFHLGDGAYITCHRYAGRTPILHVSRGDTSFSLSLLTEQDPTDADLQIARDLVDAALAFQAEVERLACGAPTAAAS